MQKFKWTVSVVKYGHDASHSNTICVWGDVWAPCVGLFPLCVGSQESNSTSMMVHVGDLIHQTTQGENAWWFVSINSFKLVDLLIVECDFLERSLEGLLYSVLSSWLIWSNRWADIVAPSASKLPRYLQKVCPLTMAVRFHYRCFWIPSTFHSLHNPRIESFIRIHPKSVDWAKMTKTWVDDGGGEKQSPASTAVSLREDQCACSQFFLHTDLQSHPVAQTRWTLALTEHVTQTNFQYSTCSHLFLRLHPGSLSEYSSRPSIKPTRHTDAHSIFTSKIHHP